MKNKFMRTACMLLVLVMVSMIAVGGTFAKYVTKVENTDNARVAYWGFENSASTNFEGEPAIVKFNLFDPAYLNGDKTTVNSQDGTDVYAPGTSGEANVTFNYIGRDGIIAPEVAYNFGIEAEFCGSMAADYYKHMTYTVRYGDTTVTCASEDELLQAIARLVDPSLTNDDIEIEAVEKDGVTYKKINVTKEYAPNKLPAYLGDGTKTNILYIGWNWQFENAEDADWDSGDTDLGNSYFYLSNHDQMELTLKITATQVD